MDFITKKNGFDGPIQANWYLEALNPAVQPNSMFQGVRVPAFWFRFGFRAGQTNDAPLQNPEIDTQQSLLRTMIWMMISLIEKVTCLNHQTRENV